MNEVIEGTTPPSSGPAPFDLKDIAAANPWLAGELAKLPPDEWISALGGELFIAY